MALFQTWQPSSANWACWCLFRKTSDPMTCTPHYKQTFKARFGTRSLNVEYLCLYLSLLYPKLAPTESWLVCGCLWPCIALMLQGLLLVVVFRVHVFILTSTGLFGAINSLCFKSDVECFCPIWLYLILGIFIPMYDIGTARRFLKVADDPINGNPKPLFFVRWACYCLCRFTAVYSLSYHCMCV